MSYGYQDTDTLKWVYNDLAKFRKAEGLTKTYRSAELEKIAQSAGFIWKHSQHKKQDRQAMALARRFKRYGIASVIACADRLGCRNSHGFSRKNPGKIWKDWRYRTGHYDSITKSKNQIFGCSVDKRSIGGGAYGYSIWCLIIAA